MNNTDKEELENEEYEYVEEVESSEEDALAAIKKYGTYLVIGLIVILGGIWGFGQYQDSQIAGKEEASKHFNKAMMMFEDQKFNLALNGSDATSEMTFKGFKAIADDYSGLEVAKTSSFYAARMLASNGDNSSAKTYYLNAIGSTSYFVKLGANLGLASIYENENDYSNAAKSYKSAVDLVEFGDLKSKYGYFAALNYEKAGDKTQAENLLKNIILENKNKYGDKYKGLAEATLVRLGTKFEKTPITE